MNYLKAYALLVQTASAAIDALDKARVISPEMEEARQILRQGLAEAEAMYVGTDA